MLYDIKLFDNPPVTDARFILGTEGQKPLFIIGLNPSTADEHKPDLTIKKVIKFAEKDFDSFIMFNLYPQRATSPLCIYHERSTPLHKDNIAVIASTLKKHQNPVILACWGETIRVRLFLFDCLKDIYNASKELNVKCMKIGNTLTKSDHPRHPSRASYEPGLSAFDIENYLLNHTSNLKRN